MIKPFSYYLKENLVRKSIPNAGMAKSLLDKSQIRMKRIKNAKPTEEEASIIFEDIYKSLQEASQSIMELKGYKPYSHEALVSFLKENNVLPADKVVVIDNYRVLRNNSVYKAEKVSLEKCNEALDFAAETVPKLKKVFEQMVKSG